MLKKVRALAMEKYAGNLSKVDDFLEGFKKHAFVGDGKKTPGSAGGENLPMSLQKGLYEGFGKGMGGLAVGMGMTAVGSLYGRAVNANLHNKFLLALKTAYSSNRILAEADKGKVIGYAETVFKFAPNVATDPNLLSSILANAIHGEGIDPMTIKTLTDLESKYVENNTFSPKTYV